MGVDIVPCTLLVGNPRLGSRTMSVARRATAELRRRLAAEEVVVDEPAVVDLAELGPALPSRLLGGGDEGIGAALGTVRTPGLLVVASPTFKGSYTGLLKLFLDMLPRDGLAGTVGVALMTSAWPQHGFAADSYLRALLVELAAVVPAPGLSIVEDEFPRVEQVVAGWSGRGVPGLAAVLRRLSGPRGALVSSAPHRSGGDVPG